jgi:hypothetical protein
VIVALTLAAAALAGAPAPPALSVTPTHVALAAGSSATIHVRSGARRVLALRASVAGLALDRRGRPAITAGRDARAWLAVRPRTISVGPKGAAFVIASRPPAHARPGDHSAVVLLTASAPGGKGIPVEMRVGLVVTVRVAGHTARRLALVALRSRAFGPGRRGRIVSVTVANRGDVIESIGGAALELALVQHGRVLARLHNARRKLLPRTNAVVTFRVPARIRGDVVARVSVMRAGAQAAARRFPLRL